jgi:hypothetical protein
MAGPRWHEVRAEERTENTNYFLFCFQFCRSEFVHAYLLPGTASQLDRGRAMLGLHHDEPSRRSGVRTVWRRVSDPQRGPARCSQSLQPDELGTGRLGAVPNMVRQSRLTDQGRDRWRLPLERWLRAL